jgi:hypothetical protein
MPENSTPASTPATGTVDVAELVASENFMQDIMGALAPGEKVAQNVQENVQEKAQENVAKIQEKQETKANEQQENVQDNVQDNEQKTEENKQAVDENLEKRLKDSQAMIGRQSNELGQLRKQVSEMQTTLEADRKNKGQDSIPYYEKLLTNTPEVLSEQLKIPIDQVATLQMAARMAKDVAKDMVRPFEQIAQEAALQKEVAKKDGQWYADHPDYKNRQPIMAKFLNKVFPNGPVANGADPWQAAHMAYEHAGEVMASVQQTTTQQNDKRIVNARSLEGSNKGVQTNQLQSQSKPLDAKAAEIDKALQGQLAELTRGRG